MGNACSGTGNKKKERDRYDWASIYLDIPKCCRDPTIWGVLSVFEDTSKKYAEWSDIELNMDEHNIGLILRDPCFNVPIKPIGDYRIFLTRVDHPDSRPCVFLTDSSTFITSCNYYGIVPKDTPIPLMPEQSIMLIAQPECEGEPWRGIRFVYREPITWIKPPTSELDDQSEGEIPKPLLEKIKEKLIPVLEAQIKKDLKKEIKAEIEAQVSEQVPKTKTIMQEIENLPADLISL